MNGSGFVFNISSRMTQVVVIPSFFIWLIVENLHNHTLSVWNPSLGLDDEIKPFNSTRMPYVSIFRCNKKATSQCFMFHFYPLHASLTGSHYSVWSYPSVLADWIDFPIDHQYVSDSQCLNSWSCTTEKQSWSSWKFGVHVWFAEYLFRQLLQVKREYHWMTVFKDNTRIRAINKAERIGHIKRLRRENVLWLPNNIDAIFTLNSYSECNE